MEEEKRGLAARLATVRELQKKKEEQGRHTGRREASRPQLSDGWSCIGSYTWYKKTVYEEVALPDCSAHPLFPAEKTREDILFFDVETTGLSGGAGNIAFLVGFGRVVNTCFQVEQYFLSDYPGEGEFLQAMSSLLSEQNVYISYNGKRFDSHLLINRGIMNRLHVSFPYHIDLLYPVRRIWKQVIGSCSLSNIEAHILNIERGLDVPGYLVPELYFEYLRTGESRGLEPVFTHNMQDILSLAHLFRLIGDLLQGERSDVAVDRLGLGRYMLEFDPERGEKLLLDNFEDRDYLSGKCLSLYYKRMQRWEDALSLWKRMWRDHQSQFAAVELAKYLEHRVKQYRQALDLVEQLLSSRIYTAESYPELVWRKKRLEKKLTGR